MKRVLLLATTTGYQIRAFGEAAERVGVELVFASDRCGHLNDPWRDGAIPVRFHDIAASCAAVAASWRGERPDGIIAVGDRPTVLAAHLAAAWGLPGNPPEAAAASRDKRAMRQALHAARLPAPEALVVARSSDPLPLAAEIAWRTNAVERHAPDVRVLHARSRSSNAGARIPDREPGVAQRGPRYPVVIKPIALSGSRGVMRANDEREFVAAFERLRRLLDSPDVRAERDDAHEHILIESFIPGREFAVEGLLTRGAFQLLAIFDKPDPLDGPFFEETIYVTPSRAPVATQQRIREAVARAAAAIGLYHGPIHAECRVNEAGVFVLEAAARPIGGLCGKALRFDAGGRETIALEEVLLRHAIGEDTSRYCREARASGVMMIPIPRRGVFRGVEGSDAARAVPGIDDLRVTAKPGSLLLPLPEARSYLGFIFAHAETAAAVELALRSAHARLRFLIDREVAVVRTG